MKFITKEILNQNIIPTAPNAETDQDIKLPLIKANVYVRHDITSENRHHYHTLYMSDVSFWSKHAVDIP